VQRSNNASVPILLVSTNTSASRAWPSSTRYSLQQQQQQQQQQHSSTHVRLDPWKHSNAPSSEVQQRQPQLSCCSCLQQV
jgi:hypothetical protein